MKRLLLTLVLPTACSRAVRELADDPVWSQDTGEGWDTGDDDVLVLINELCSAPLEGEDWLELYNAGARTVDLSGWGLANFEVEEDEDQDPEPYLLPLGTALNPRDFLLLYASGEGEELETDFKLSAEGERLRLFSARGALKDEVDFPPLGLDEAYARETDGSEVWTIVAGGGTPGQSNGREDL